MHGDGMYADGTDVGRQDRGGSPGRGRRAAAILALILGLVGFAVSMTGVAIQLLPRQFTAGQQRQIEAWEVMRRWQTMPAGQIFPASVSYQLSARCSRTRRRLTWTRSGSASRRSNPTAPRP